LIRLAATRKPLIAKKTVYRNFTNPNRTLKYIVKGITNTWNLLHRITVSIQNQPRQNDADSSEIIISTTIECYQRGEGFAQAGGPLLKEGLFILQKTVTLSVTALIVLLLKTWPICWLPHKKALLNALQLADDQKCTNQVQTGFSLGS
jgi:hypothetical protein